MFNGKIQFSCIPWLFVAFLTCGFVQVKNPLSKYQAKFFDKGIEYLFKTFEEKSLLGEAENYAANGLYTEAIKSLERVLEINSKNQGALYLISFLYSVKLNNLEKSLYFAEKCQALNPESAWGYKALADYYLIKKDWNRASLLYNQALTYKKDLYSASNNQVFLYLQTGELQKAAELGENLILQDDNTPDWHANLWAVYLMSGKMDLLEKAVTQWQNKFKGKELHFRDQSMKKSFFANLARIYFRIYQNNKDYYNDTKAILSAGIATDHANEELNTMYLDLEKQGKK